MGPERTGVITDIHNKPEFVVYKPKRSSRLHEILNIEPGDLRGTRISSDIPESEFALIENIPSLSNNNPTDTEQPDFRGESDSHSQESDIERNPGDGGDIIPPDDDETDFDYNDDYEKAETRLYELIELLQVEQREYDEANKRLSGLKDTPFKKAVEDAIEKQAKRLEALQKEIDAILDQLGVMKIIENIDFLIKQYSEQLGEIDMKFVMEAVLAELPDGMDMKRYKSIRRAIGGKIAEMVGGLHDHPVYSDSELEDEASHVKAEQEEEVPDDDEDEAGHALDDEDGEEGEAPDDDEDEAGEKESESTDAFRVLTEEEVDRMREEPDVEEPYQGIRKTAPEPDVEEPRQDIAETTVKAEAESADRSEAEFPGHELHQVAAMGGGRYLVDGQERQLALRTNARAAILRQLFTDSTLFNRWTDTQDLQEALMHAGYVDLGGVGRVVIEINAQLEEHKIPMKIVRSGAARATKYRLEGAETLFGLEYDKEGSVWFMGRELDIDDEDFRSTLLYILQNPDHVAHGRSIVDAALGEGKYSASDWQVFRQKLDKMLGDMQNAAFVRNVGIYGRGAKFQLVGLQVLGRISFDEDVETKAFEDEVMEEELGTTQVPVEEVAATMPVIAETAEKATSPAEVVFTTSNDSVIVNGKEIHLGFLTPVQKKLFGYIIRRGLQREDGRSITVSLNGLKSLRLGINLKPHVDEEIDSLLVGLQHSLQGNGIPVRIQASEGTAGKYVVEGIDPKLGISVYPEVRRVYAGGVSFELADELDGRVIQYMLSQSRPVARYQVETALGTSIDSRDFGTMINRLKALSRQIVGSIIDQHGKNETADPILYVLSPDDDRLDVWTHSQGDDVKVDLIQSIRRGTYASRNVALVELSEMPDVIRRLYDQLGRYAPEQTEAGPTVPTAHELYSLMWFFSEQNKDKELQTWLRENDIDPPDADALEMLREHVDNQTPSNETPQPVNRPDILRRLKELFDHEDCDRIIEECCSKAERDARPDPRYEALVYFITLDGQQTRLLEKAAESEVVLHAHVRVGRISTVEDATVHREGLPQNGHK